MTNVTNLADRKPLAKRTLLTPEEVLPDPSMLYEPIALDTETSGLYVDEGHRVCAVSVSFRTKDAPHVHQDVAFPFDQGRHEEKGFEIQRYKSGMPKGVASEAELADWLADYNLDSSHWRWLCDWLKASGHEVGHIYQNAQFDLIMFDAGLRTGEAGMWLEPYVVWDSMLASKNLWPTESTSLKPTGERLWGSDRVADAAELRDALIAGKKLFGLRAEHGPRYDLVPWSINGKYAASDTSLTLDLKELQHKMLEDGMGQGWGDFNREMNLMRVLTRMSRRGFGPYSVEESHEWANVIAGRLQEIEPTLPFARQGTIDSDKIPEIDLASSEPEDYPIIGASTVRASEYYFEKLGIKPWKVGETKRGYEVGKGIHKKFVPGLKADRKEVERRFPTETEEKLVVFKQGELTADIAKRLGEEGAPGATDYAEYLRLKIANQMFYRNYAELAGPGRKLRTTYRQARVKSARLSVERFQAQALPKKLELVCHGVKVPEPRAFFGVPEGRQRWNLDLSQAELRIAANLAHCKGLMQELNEDGRDVHGSTCERTFSITPDHPDWKGKRDVAKRLNFGGIFMIGPKTFQTNLWTQGGIEWPLVQCKEAVMGFRAAYPEIEDAYKYWLDYAAQHGAIVLYNGQRSWFGRMDYPNTGWNRRVQGPQTTSTPIHTINRGWIRAGDVVPGDALHGRNEPTVVEAVQNAGVNRIHRVHGHDGRHLDVAGNHRWTAYRVRNDWAGGNPERELSTLELADQVGRKGGYDRLPLMEAYNGPDVSLPVDPYLLGAWLGDGDRTQINCDVTIHSNVDDYGHLVAKIGEPRRIRPMPDKRTVNITWNWAGRGPGRKRGPGVTAAVLRDEFETGMATYDGGSKAQRLALLRGLMDTDGCSFAARPTLAQFTNVDERKAELVARLARGLGGLARATKHSHAGGQDYYRVRLSMPEGSNPFSLPRKADNWRPGACKWLKVVAVEELPVALPTVCFQVSAADGLYAAGEGYTVTHNSLAIWVAEWLTLVEQATEKYDALVLTAHDSSMLDLPEDQAEDIVARVVELSGELWVDRFGFPGKVDADRWAYHEGVDLRVPAHLARQFEGCDS